MPIDESQVAGYIIPSVIAAGISAVFIFAKKVSKSSDDVLSDSIKLDRLQRDMIDVIEKLDKIADRLDRVESTSKIHDYRLDHPSTSRNDNNR